MSPRRTGDVSEEQVLALLNARRERAQIFGAGLFDDPAWDILLELFAAELGERKIGLDDLVGIAPKSVTARWLAALEERGLVECEIRSLQPKQFSIRLSPDCSAKMSLFLSCARHRVGFG